MPTSPIPLDLVPGVILTDTAKAAGPRVVSADHVRVRAKRYEKIGGWEKRVDDQILGLVRGMFSWVARRGIDLVAAGTYIKLYSVSDELQDITPLDSSGSLGTDPFETTDGSTEVVVNHTAHGREEGAYVDFDGATAGGGITIDGTYTVASVVDDNSFTIIHSTSATSTDSSTGGSSVTYEYEINPGLQTTAYGTGWGVGGWGEGTWGTPRSISDAITLELRYWCIVNYGTQLAVQPFGGTVYLWDEPAGDARAAAVSNAPASARAMFITPERMITMLGTSAPMVMEWCDRDDPTDWTPATSNTANIRTLQSGNKLMNGTVFGTISLIWSDTSVYLHQFSPGDDFIYRTDVIATGCGLLAAGAFVVTPIGVFWMSDVGFHVFSGGVVSIIQRSEEIRDYVFGRQDGTVTGNLDRNYAAKTFAGFNKRFNEVWFGYVSIDSEDGEPDRYISVAIDEDWSWMPGTLTRTAMASSKQPIGTVVMAGVDNYIYSHEIGLDADSAALDWHLETGVVALGDGAIDQDIDGFEPDLQRQTGAITLTIFTKDRPRGEDLESTEYEIGASDTLVDARVGGRYAGLRLSQEGIVGGDFRLGVPAIELGGAGSKR